MKKIYSLVAGMLAFSAVNAQLLQENFDAGIPGTWVVTDAGGVTGDSWATGNTNGNGTLDGTDCAFVDSDANGNGTHLIETLESPAFDGTGFASVVLEFDHYFRSVSAGDSGVVEVWDGAQWQQVVIFNDITGSVGGFSNPDHQTIDITVYANPAMQVRFHYDDNNSWAWYWLVDNVVVNGSNCDLVSGLTTSNVTDVTADLTWTSAGANFDVQWGAPGFMPGTGAELGSDYVATTNTTATGLTQNTAYEAWVRSNCAGTSLMISAAYDGPLTGGHPKGVELYALEDIADLSAYGVSSANNGGGTTTTPEFVFPAVSVTAGSYIYVTADSAGFHDFFGFAADYEDGSANINGDDAIELYWNGAVVDVFGDVNVDGTGETWEYLDGWAYRNTGTQPNTTFTDTDWSYSGINALDGETDNATATTPVPIGTFTTVHAVSGWIGPVAFTTMYTEDASLSSILTPITGCGLTANDTVTVLLENFGADTIFSFDVCYVMNAAAPVCETVNDTILPNGGSFTHVFATTVDLTTPGTYTFDAYVTVVADSNATNDTLTGYTMQSVPTISSLPYSEDFESGAGGWSAEVNAGTTSWELGTPAAALINSVSACEGGTNAWVTNLTGAYGPGSNTDLYSPCFDFSAETADPVISFDIRRESEDNWDGTILEMSIDGGATWAQLGAVGTGANWYNNATDVWWDGSFAWAKAGHVLTGSAGASEVRLRFKFTSDGSVQEEGTGIDNIAVNASAPIISATPGNLVAPVSDCGLTANEFVVADFANNGLDTLFTFDVCYIVNGGTPVCETVTDTILPGGTYQHAFATAGDFSAIGANNVDVVITATGDLSTCDDTATAVVNNKPVISTYPYLETFENGQGGWAANNNTNGSWEFGTPAQPNINSAYSGINAWVAGGLSGGYNNNEDGNIESPCFDFTNLPMGSWVALKVFYDCENSWDGANLELSDDGGTTWTLVGAFGAPDWYNDNTINATPGGTSQDGWTSNGTDWVIMKHPLDDTLIGKTDVLFRVNFASDGSVPQNGFAFDDFAISTLPTVDAGPDYNGCGSHLIDPGLVGMYDWFTQDTSAAPTSYPHSNGTSATFTNTGLTDTTYNAIVVYTDSFGLCASDTAMLTLNPAPFVDLTDVSNCPGDTAWFNVDTASIYTYSWSTGATVDSSFLGAPGQIIATVTHTGTGCSHSDSANVYQVPLVDLDPTTTACDGDSILVDAGSNYDVYVWDDGASTSSIYVYSSDTVMVTVTDSIGCMSSDSAILTVNALPMPAITGSMDTICVNHDISLDAGAGFSVYSWSTGGSAQTEPVSGSTLGTGSHDIIVMVTDGNNCMNSDTVTIFVDPCTGIDGIDAVGFSVYPNPSNGIFKYNVDELDNAMTFRLTDATGKLINTWTINNAQIGTIDLTGYARGVYILNVIYGEGQKSIQLIRQ